MTSDELRRRVLALQASLREGGLDAVYSTLDRLLSLILEEVEDGLEEEAK